MRPAPSWYNVRELSEFHVTGTRPGHRDPRRGFLPQQEDWLRVGLPFGLQAEQIHV